MSKPAPIYEGRNVHIVQRVRCSMRQRFSPRLKPPRARGGPAGRAGTDEQADRPGPYVSERTAENHVQHILTKLGLRNRSQIAAWASGERDASRL